MEAVLSCCAPIQEEFLVPSFTGGNIYRVQAYADGSYACDCPAHRFYSEERGACKHIKAVRRGDYGPIDSSQDAFPRWSGSVLRVTMAPEPRFVDVPVIHPGWPETGQFALTIVHDLLDLGLAWTTIWTFMGEWLYQDLTAMDVRDTIAKHGRVCLRGKTPGAGFQNPYQREG